MSNGNALPQQTEAMPAIAPAAPALGDMADMPADFERWSFLSRVPLQSRDSLLSFFIQADQAAQEAQAQHLRWVSAAAISATLAVCLAILQLAGINSMVIAEVTAVAVAA